MNKGIILTAEQEMNCSMPVDILMGLMVDEILLPTECLIFLN
jgi:hypothetical protein